MEKFASRKLAVALFVILIEFLKGFGLSLPPESSDVIMNVAIAYLSGQSIIDTAVLFSKKKK